MECSFTLTKVDNTPPTVVCPPNQTLLLASDCTAAIPDYRSLATTFDACGISSVVQVAPPGFIVSGTGSINAALIVTDGNNNVAQCSFTITKVDNTPPSINCPAAQTLVLGSTCSAVLPDYRSLAVTSDNCGVQSIAQSPASGAVVSNAGNMTVTLTVTDINGNSTPCSFTVTKVDNTPPTVQCFPQTLTFNGQTQFDLNVDDLVDAADNCGVASISLYPDYITCEQLGQIVLVVITVTDINNNVTTCTSQITVTACLATGAKTPTAWAVQDATISPTTPARAGWLLGGESTPAMVILVLSPTTPSGYACHPSTGGNVFFLCQASPDIRRIWDGGQILYQRLFYEILSPKLLLL